MTDPSQPPRMLIAPLRLTAMTLRGLGPYLHGARLEIKPLTILCGQNGSGKSMWIETLRLLKLNIDKNNDFPLFDGWYPLITGDEKNPEEGHLDTLEQSYFERSFLNANLVSLDESSSGPGVPLEERKRQSEKAKQRRILLNVE